MPIPDYGLKDPVTGQQILSRDRKYNHPWWSSKHLDYYDNETFEQMTDSLPVPFQPDPNIVSPNILGSVPVIPL